MARNRSQGLLRIGTSARLGRKQKLIAAALAILLCYSSSSVLSGLRSFHAAAATKLQRLKQKLAECKSEVGYLCWETREVVDAGFLGDAAVMASYIAGVKGPPAIGPAQRRGIVVAAGGRQYAANAFVNLYVLRHFLNCTLPVALMYWGKSKSDAIPQSTLDFMKAHLSNIQFIDASVLPYPAHQRWLFPPGDDSRFNGYRWKVKVFALYAAPFEEVLLLDGDSMPLQSMAELFEHPLYQQHGSMLWPDTWCRPIELMAKLNLPNPWEGGRRAWQTDSGQLLFNRKRHPDVLEWLLFLNTHDEFTYFYSYGDKDSFRAAFHLANKSDAYYQVPQRISVPLHQGRGKGMVVRGILQHDPEGALLFVHRMGPGPRKYDCSSNEGRPITHLLHQPTCSYLEEHPLQQHALGIPGRLVLTPQRCPYDLERAQQARAACGVDPEGEGLQTGASRVDPVVFEVPSSARLAQVQQQADAAFRLFRERLRTDPSLC